jgi:hypothetical protein
MAGSSHKSFLDRILSYTGCSECCQNDVTLNFQDIEMAPESSSESKGVELYPIAGDEEKGSESNVQKELNENPAKFAVSRNSTPSTSSSCSDHESSENSIEDIPQAQMELSTTLPSSEKTTEAMPQAQTETVKISIPDRLQKQEAQKQHRLDTVVSLMSRQVSLRSQTFRKHQKTIKIAVVVCFLIFTAMVVGQIVAMKGDGGEDQVSGGNSTDASAHN